MSDDREQLAAGSGPPESDSYGTSAVSGPASRCYLFSCPNEVLARVYELLPVPDRLRFRRTCSTLREVYDSSALLQYEFTLETTAYLNVPNQITLDFLPPSQTSSGPLTSSTPSSTTNTRSTPIDKDASDPRPTVNGVHLAPLPPKGPKPAKVQTDLSFAEKNERLKEREKRWDTLDAAEKRRFKLLGPVGVYELQEGILLMCDDYTREDDSRPESVRLIPLPSADDPDLQSPLMVTTKSKVSFRIADLTMDPTQDLIVVSEYLPEPRAPHRQPTHRYHLLRLSDFTPHPLAEHPQLDFPPFLNNRPTRTRQLLQVMGDTLVVLVSWYHDQWVVAGFNMIGLGMGTVEADEEIVAWNWKTGKVLGRMALPTNAWFSSFAMLTPTSVMITTPSDVSHDADGELLSVASIFPPVIQIWSFLPDPNHTFEAVQPLGTDSEDDTTLRFRLLTQLELPQFAESATVSEFNVRPDPAFPPMTQHRVPRLGAKGFTQDPEKGLLVFELEVMEPNESIPGILDMIHRKSYELFVNRETLVQMSREGEERLRAFQATGGIDDGSGQWRVEKKLTWAEWGEKYARLMDGSPRKRVWVCSCSGYRYVSLVRTDREYRRRRRRREEEDDVELITDVGVVSGDEAMEDEMEDWALGEEEEGVTDQDEEEEVVEEAEEDNGQFEDDDDDDDDPNLNGLDPPSHRCDIRILDFSPTRLCRDLIHGCAIDTSSPNSPLFEVEIHTEPSVLPRRKVWKHDVRSGLGYREVVRKVGVRANGIMMDDQRVIMINSKDRTSIRVAQEMTVFCM